MNRMAALLGIMIVAMIHVTVYADSGFIRGYKTEDQCRKAWSKAHDDLTVQLSSIVSDEVLTEGEVFLLCMKRSDYIEIVRCARIKFHIMNWDGGEDSALGIASLAVIHAYYNAKRLRLEGKEMWERIHRELWAVAKTIMNKVKIFFEKNRYIQESEQEIKDACRELIHLTEPYIYAASSDWLLPCMVNEECPKEDAQVRLCYYLAELYLRYGLSADYVDDRCCGDDFWEKLHGVLTKQD